MGLLTIGRRRQGDRSRVLEPSNAPWLRSLAPSTLVVHCTARLRERSTPSWPCSVRSLIFILVRFVLVPPYPLLAWLLPLRILRLADRILLLAVRILLLAVRIMRLAVRIMRLAVRILLLAVRIMRLAVRIVLKAVSIVMLAVRLVLLAVQLMLLQCQLDVAAPLRQLRLVFPQLP